MDASACRFGPVPSRHLTHIGVARCSLLIARSIPWLWPYPDVNVMLGAALASFGFADLEGLAKRSIEKLNKQQEARARFGDDLFADTPAERFCAHALDGLDRGNGWTFDKAEVEQRFAACADLVPHTLGDCLHELAYWNHLYRLRNAVNGYGDPIPEASERDNFVFRCLARIRARTKDEAIAVFRYLSDSDRMDATEANDILLNLIG